MIEECRVAGRLSQTSPSPSILSGPLIGGFLHPFGDGIFMFTGGGRCGDRISPAFGSVVNVLVVLGHVLGFWSVYSSTLSPHTLPAPTTMPLTQPRVTSGIKTLLTLSPQGQKWPGDETRRDKCLLRELT